MTDSTSLVLRVNVDEIDELYQAVADHIGRRREREREYGDDA